MYRTWDKSKPPSLSSPIVLNRDCLAAQGLVLWLPVHDGISGFPQIWDHAGLFNVVGNYFSTQGTWKLSTGGAGETVGEYNGTDTVLQSANVIVYAAPLSVSAWIQKTDITVTGGISAFGDYTLGSGARRFQFDVFSSNLRWIAVGASTGTATGPASTLVNNKWHHVMGIEISSTSRYAAIDGVLGSQNTTSATPGGTPNRTVVGALFNSGSNSSFFGGKIGEVCIWNISQYGREAMLADPARRFELWYPLRSKKWFTQPSTFVRFSVARSREAVNRASRW